MASLYRYISLLRGINVSGQKPVKMDALRALFISLGFYNVQTYIQSGNVIFDAPYPDPSQVITRIESAIEPKFGFHVPLQIRTPEDLARIIAANPFAAHVDEANGTRVLVTFLADEPPTENVDRLKTFVSPPEMLEVIGREVYLYCPDGYGRSKLSNTFIESKLAVPATTRNWKTILKLGELASHLV